MPIGGHSFEILQGLSSGYATQKSFCFSVWGALKGNSNCEVKILWLCFILCVIRWPGLEKAMAPHSSTLAWKIPWRKEPGRLQSMGLRKVGHNWTTSLSLFTSMHWRRKWQPTPVFLPGESQGWGCTESDTTEVT